MQLLCGLAVLLAIHTAFPGACVGSEDTVSASSLDASNELRAELRSYRVRLEAEAGLLRRINEHQRNEQNLHSKLTERRRELFALRDELKALRLEINASRASGGAASGSGADRERKRRARAKAEAQAAQAIQNDQMANASSSVAANALPRGAAPSGVAVLVVASDDNVVELGRTLRSLLRRVPATGFPIFVSHRGSGGVAADAIEKAMQGAPGGGKNRPVFRLEYTLTGDKPTTSREGARGGAAASAPASSSAGGPVTHRISAENDGGGHLFWSLSRVFDYYSYSKVIVLDTYTDVAVDFFDYFEATAKLIDRDAGIVCVSAWNDNGQAEFAKDSGAISRTDLFPDYAWMINSDLWIELQQSWPATGWRAWLKTREHAKKTRRSCIIPEVCRVSVRERPGMSKADRLRYEQFMGTVKLNKNAVKFSAMDLSFLETKTYDSYLRVLLESSVTIRSASSLVNGFQGKPGNLKIMYDDAGAYVAIADILGLPNTLQAGYPAGSYRGIVTLRYGTWRVFIAPRAWKDRLKASEPGSDGGGAKPGDDEEQTEPEGAPPLRGLKKMAANSGR